MTIWRRTYRSIFLVVWAGLMAACVSTPRTQLIAEPQATIPISTQVYFYPLRDQSEQQQDRDQYQCYLWARKQTGFDPSAPELAPHQRVEVVPDPEAGSDTVASALAGAIIGSMIGGHHDGVDGAVTGAMAGAMIGASADASRQQQAQHMQAYYDRLSAQQREMLERQAANYRRALTACLEGRGYSVR